MKRSGAISGFLLLFAVIINLRMETVGAKLGVIRKS